MEYLINYRTYILRLEIASTLTSNHLRKPRDELTCIHIDFNSVRGTLTLPLPPSHCPRQNLNQPLQRYPLNSHYTSLIPIPSKEPLLSVESLAMQAWGWDVMWVCLTMWRRHSRARGILRDGTLLFAQPSVLHYSPMLHVGSASCPECQ